MKIITKKQIQAEFDNILSAKISKFRGWIEIHYFIPSYIMPFIFRDTFLNWHHHINCTNIEDERTKKEFKNMIKSFHIEYDEYEYVMNHDIRPTKNAIRRNKIRKLLEYANK